MDTSWLYALIPSIVSAVATAIVGFIVKKLLNATNQKITAYKDDFNSIKKGVQAGLRHDLLEIYDYWHKKGFMPREVKKDFENIYLQYHNLGSNGVMDTYYNEVLNMKESLNDVKRTNRH